MKRRALALTCAALLGIGGAAASAEPRATVYAGLEVGDTDSNRLEAGASARFLDTWTAGLSLARANVEFPDVSTSSTLAVAKAGHDFGAFSVGGGYRRGEIEDVSTSRGWFATAGYALRELSFGLEIEARRTSLEPAAFTEDLGGGLGVVSGVSHCRVDGRGYQGRVDWDRPAWSLFASLRRFDYDDYDCALDIAQPPASGGGNGNGNGNGNGPPPHARGRALGRRLAAASVDAASGAASRLAPREAALLESSAALGFTMPVTANWIGGAELYRDVERIDGSDTLTGLIFAGRRLSDSWTVELSLGYSSAEEIDDTAFAGVRVTAAL
jgi:hypothetical protein